jgi:hypothetical protein
MKRPIFQLFLFTTITLILTVAAPAQGNDANPLGVFDFDFKRLGETPADQVRALKKIGFSGATLSFGADFNAFSKEIKVDNFKVYAAHKVIYIGEKTKFNSQQISRAVDQVKSVNADLWLIILEKKGDKASASLLLKTINQVADICAKKGVRCVLYPHDNTLMESAEDAIDLLEKSKRNDLFISFHLCHEIQRVIDTAPDLVVLAFGMNDGSQGKDTELWYKPNTTGMIDALRAANPDVSIILVAEFSPNPEQANANYGLREQNRAALYDLYSTYGNMAFVDVGAVSRQIAARKKFQDFSGNCLNHPNDFMHTVYAELVMNVFEGSSIVTTKATDNCTYVVQGSPDVNWDRLQLHWGKGPAQPRCCPIQRTPVRPDIGLRRHRPRGNAKVLPSWATLNHQINDYLP